MSTTSTLPTETINMSTTPTETINMSTTPTETIDKSTTPTLPTVETELQYQLAPDQGGVDEIWPGLVKALRVPRVMVQTKVANVRGFEADYSLHKQGFQWVTRPAPLKTWDNDAEIKQAYYADCEALLKQATGASHAYAFNHVLRSDDWAEVMSNLGKYKDDDFEFRSANNCYIHCDYSYRGAEQYYENLIVNSAREDLRRLAAQPRCRWAMINLWRPRTTILRDALCVADAHSIRDDELAEQTIRWLRAEDLTEEQKNYPGVEKYHVGAPDTYMFAVKPPADPAQHQWFYADEMTPDEVLLFKLYDSRREEGVVRRVPHTSFRAPKDHGPPRLSVEVRAFVFWEDEAAEV